MKTTRIGSRMQGHLFAFRKTDGLCIKIIYLLNIRKANEAKLLRKFPTLETLEQVNEAKMGYILRDKDENQMV